ncbi:unnamed protein product [Calypogeia fissa]
MEEGTSPEVEVVTYARRRKRVATPQREQEVVATASKPRSKCTRNRADQDREERGKEAKLTVSSLMSFAAIVAKGVKMLSRLPRGLRWLVVEVKNKLVSMKS